MEDLDVSCVFRNADMKLAGFGSSAGLFASVFVALADAAASPDIGPSFSFPFSLESVFGVANEGRDENGPNGEDLAGAEAVATTN